jgi:hypothetical protein
MREAEKVGGAGKEKEKEEEFVQEEDEQDIAALMGFGGFGSTQVRPLSCVSTSFANNGVADEKEPS